MKLTITQLKKIISEEVKNVVLREDAASATSPEANNITAALDMMLEEIMTLDLGPTDETPKEIVLDILAQFFKHNRYK